LNAAARRLFLISNVFAAGAAWKGWTIFIMSEERNPPVRDLTPEEVARGLVEDRMVLVDVRELTETAVERYPGALIVPLSAFDPRQIPDPQGRQVVFACRSGRRSVTASQAAQAMGLPYDAHLAGGIIAWKAAGLPTES
jgi:rhodanese-related sulfurtransferase